MLEIKRKYYHFKTFGTFGRFAKVQGHWRKKNFCRSDKPVKIHYLDKRGITVFLLIRSIDQDFCPNKEWERIFMRWMFICGISRNIYLSRELSAEESLGYAWREVENTNRINKYSHLLVLKSEINNINNSTTNNLKTKRSNGN